MDRGTLPPVTPDHLRDAAMTGAILALAATVWFGWAFQGSPRSWRAWLVAGLVPSYAILIGSAIVAVLHWGDGSVFDATTSTRFGILVGIEAALAALGAGILARRRPDLVPVWIAVVVGVHFVPVAVLLHYPWLHVVAGLTTAAALAAVPVARRTSQPVSAVTGVGLGLALLIGGLVALGTALTWQA